MRRICYCMAVLLNVTILLVVYISSSLGQDTKNLLKEWGFVELFRCGTVEAIIKNGKFTGEVSAIGDKAVIEFLFKNPPLMTFAEDNRNKYFKFNTNIPKASSPCKVIFTTPKAKDAHVRIPPFKPIIRNHKTSYTSFITRQFYDYDGPYEFSFDLKASGFSVSLLDLNCFNDGAEHHIYGEVELFGVKFKNDAKEPFVFKINNWKYVYVRGKGIAKSKEGMVVNFGE